jgi:hypothetical protein
VGFGIFKQFDKGVSGQWQWAVAVSLGSSMWVAAGFERYRVAHVRGKGGLWRRGVNSRWTAAGLEITLTKGRKSCEVGLAAAGVRQLG